MNEEEKQKTIQAGKIASQIKKWVRPQIKKGEKLLDIAEKIEDKIVELGGKPAFPTSLAIDNVAAHYTPSHNDEKIAQGLLKVDFGVHVEGWVADNAFSIDLEEDEANAKIILASELALDKAIKFIKNKRKNGESVTLGQIGKEIEKVITSRELEPIRNLSGHSIEKFNLHAGSSVPNFDNKSEEEIKDGIYAIEPFATNGNGRVHDGKPAGIYQLISEKNVRSPIARQVLQYIKSEYDELPFCSRWIVKKFGPRAMFGLRELEKNENLHHFEELVEKEGSLVSQTEHTILVDGPEVIVTTL